MAMRTTIRMCDDRIRLRGYTEVTGSELTVRGMGQVLERRARVCLVNIKEECFVGGAHLVPKSNHHGGKEDWVFTHREVKGNPFTVRADTLMQLELYIELSLLCRKKDTKLQGQQALAKGELSPEK